MNCACKGVCPESKKEYPGDCRMFYKCVPLPAASRTPGSAHAYVWIPIRCTAGLVFHAGLNKCMPPEESWDCRNDEQLLHVSQILNQNEPETNEDATEDDSSTIISDSLTYADSMIFDNAESIQEDIEIITDTPDTSRVTLEPIRSTTNEKNESVIPSYHHSQIAVNSKPTSESNVDYIANQMNRIVNLVDSLKASNDPPADVQNQEFQSLKPMHSFNLLGPITVSSPVHTSNLINILANPLDSNQPTTDEYNRLNLLPIQVNKITAQLIQTKQPNPANTQQNNLNLLSKPSLHGYPNLNSEPLYFKDANTKNNGQLASMLYNKYLANKIFMKTNDAYANPTKYFNNEPNMWNIKNEYDKITGLNLHNEDYFTTNKYKTSIWPMVQVTPANVLPCTTGIRFPNASDCRRYYMCNETSATIYDYACPPSTAFNRIKRICDTEEYGRCMSPLAMTASATMASTADDKSIVLDSRPERPTDACSAEGAKLPDPMSPNHYFICVLGNDSRPKRIRISCPRTLVFCKVRSLCTAHTTC